MHSSLYIHRCKNLRLLQNLKVGIDIVGDFYSLAPYPNLLYYNINTDIDEVHLDLNSLLHRLKGDVVAINSQWYLFGLSIGVPQDFLEKLKEYPENDRLVEVLDYWLRHHSQPTWKEILDARKNLYK